VKEAEERHMARPGELRVAGLDHQPRAVLALTDVGGEVGGSYSIYLLPERK
jgi:hypothetical protein